MRRKIRKVIKGCMMLLAVCGVFAKTAYAQESEIMERELSYKLISVVEQGYRITVTGSMPDMAQLTVAAASVDERLQEEILRSSSFLATQEDYEHAKIVSFDISIEVDGLEYEPYEFGEDVEIILELLHDDWKECESIEVFHVKKDEMEKVNLSNQENTEISFLTEAFSQFIFVGEMQYEKETSWEYAYCGEPEFFTAPVNGIYKIDLYGASGSGYGDYPGGKGGHVCGYLELKKGEILQIQVGGSNGYPDGGVGTLGTGGGRTVISKADSVIAIAGGGGAAGLQTCGNPGGLQEGLWEQSYGESSDEINSAGGGAGFLGGRAGHAIVHWHTGQEDVQGGCYQEKENRLVETVGKKVCSISVTPAGIISATCPGCGETMDYVERKSYEHSGCGEETTYYDEGYCVCCNEIYKNGTELPFPSHEYEGTILTIQEYYRLSCGYQDGQIESGTCAYGGSNYADATVLSYIQDEAGVAQTNGEVRICLEKVEVCVFTYLDDMGIELAKSYVEPGEPLQFPDIGSFEKNEDEKFYYVFMGWDDLSTAEQENMTNEETLKDTQKDYTYKAVYQRTPKTYCVTLDTGETILATFEEQLPEVAVPEQTDVIFDGFYTLPDGMGQKIYDAKGHPVAPSGFTMEQTIYAHWVNPIKIGMKETDISVRYGYESFPVEILALANPAQEYELSFEWFLQDEIIADATKSSMLVPQGLSAGEHCIVCRVYAQNKKNGQKTYMDSEPIMVRVEKNVLKQSQIKVIKSGERYHGQNQTALIEIEDNEDYLIYYARTPLNEENYQEEGSVDAPQYLHAGRYPVYLYVISRDYFPMQAFRVFEIKKAVPTIRLTDSEVTFNGQCQTLSSVECLGVDGKPLQTEITCTYYTDEALTQLTGAEHGASDAGNAPSKIGKYFVQAAVAETMDYEAAKSDSYACFEIVKKSFFLPIINHTPSQPAQDTQIKEEDNAEKQEQERPLQMQEDIKNVIMDFIIEKLEKEENKEELTDIPDDIKEPEAVSLPKPQKAPVRKEKQEKRVEIQPEPDVEQSLQEKQEETKDEIRWTIKQDQTNHLPIFQPAELSERKKKVISMFEDSIVPDLTILFVMILIGFAVLKILLLSSRKKKTKKRK